MLQQPKYRKITISACIHHLHLSAMRDQLYAINIIYFVRTHVCIEESCVWKIWLCFPKNISFFLQIIHILEVWCTWSHIFTKFEIIVVNVFVVITKQHVNTHRTYVDWYAYFHRGVNLCTSGVRCWATYGFVAIDLSMMKYMYTYIFYQLSLYRSFPTLT